MDRIFNELCHIKGIINIANNIKSRNLFTDCGALDTLQTVSLEKKKLVCGTHLSYGLSHPDRSRLQSTPRQYIIISW